jgi:hypothetical protein
MQNRRNLLKSGLTGAAGVAALIGLPFTPAQASSVSRLLKKGDHFIHEVPLSDFYAFMKEKCGFSGKENLKDFGYDVVQPFINFMNVNFLHCEEQKANKDDVCLVRNIIMPPEVFALLRVCGRDIYDEATQREMQETGIFGHIWTSDIMVNRDSKSIIFIYGINQG